MRKTNFFSMTALICLFTLGVSCSKDDTGVPPNDDSENPSDETGFTLTIPALVIIGMVLIKRMMRDLMSGGKNLIKFSLALLMKL